MAWGLKYTDGSIRGQSGPVGLVLIIGLVITSTSIVVIVGGIAINDTQQQLDSERTEKTMTQLDSQASLVSLGQSSSQQVRLPDGSANSYRVNSSAGYMNISYTNDTGDTEWIQNTTMGALIAEGERGQVAYQGGGVWRSDGNGNSVMVSPPEFNYRDQTLTLPLVKIAGDGDITNRVVISQRTTARSFPDKNEAYTNPLNGSEVNVSVTSEYYLAWGQYFEERTEGTVIYDDQNKTVVARLTVPFDLSEAVDQVIGTTNETGLTANGGSRPASSEQGVDFRSGAVDELIENEVSSCTGSCTDGGSTTINTPGKYRYSGDPSDLTVNSPGGDVTIAIDGAYNPDDMEIRNLDESYSVTILVRNDYRLYDKQNVVDGDPGDLAVLVHSDGQVDLQGGSTFVGLLLAPGSNCYQNGGGNVTGGMLCESAEIRGVPSSTWNYDPAVTNFDISLTNPGETRITYLHVSENRVVISD